MEDSPENGKGSANDKSNVVQMPTLAQRDKMRREAEEAERKLEKKNAGRRNP